MYVSSAIEHFILIVDYHVTDHKAAWRCILDDHEKPISRAAVRFSTHILQYITLLWPSMFMDAQVFP